MGSKKSQSPFIPNRLIFNNTLDQRDGFMEIGPETANDDASESQEPQEPQEPTAAEDPIAALVNSATLAFRENMGSSDQERETKRKAAQLETARRDAEISRAISGMVEEQVRRIAG